MTDSILALESRPGTAVRRPSPGSSRAQGTSTRIALVVTLVAAGCAGSPWFMGHPLDGRTVVPARSRALTVADHRRDLDAARARGEKVVELAELGALEERGALRPDDVKRFAALLRERARDWIALRRPIPLAEDLRHLVALEPARARALTVPLRNADRAAGDAWLALGENARAEVEYRAAERLGATGMLFRFRAAWEASPADLDDDTLARGLAELPERALAPFAAAYLDGGGADPALVRRAWRAARVYGPAELVKRIEGLPTVTREAGGSEASIGGDRDPADSVALPEPRSDDRLYHGPTLVRALSAAAAAFPNLLEPGPRSRDWADRLLAEDSTSPDSLELAALIDARAGRTEGAAEKLSDLVFYSSDRAAGYARVARVWERTGEPRRACLAWEKAAHLGAVDDPRWCDLIACLRRNPGAGDADAVARFARLRSTILTCDAAPPDTGSLAPDAGVDAPLRTLDGTASL